MKNSLYMKRQKPQFKQFYLLFLLIFCLFLLLFITLTDSKKNLIKSRAQNKPTCDPNNLNMSINPNPALVNSLIMFSLSGTEGDTWIEDYWYPPEGVDCQGNFWGSKSCRALKAGSYIWEHRWRKCVGTFENCSDVCNKTAVFQIVDNFPSIPTPTLTPTPTPTPVTNSPTPIPTQTPTPTLSLTPTPTPSFVNMKIHLRLRFQGIQNKPSDNLNNLLIKITFKNDKKSINETVEKTFLCNNQLIWYADPIEISLPSDTNYSLLIKGPKHLQKKICHNYPAENFSGEYICRNPSLQLKEGDNLLDFSLITIFSGDLPPQDNILNSYDLSLVRNNLGSTQEEIISKADINLDGVVDTQDFSLLLSSMKIKLDEF